MLPALTLGGTLRYAIIRSRLRQLPIRSILEIGPGVGALATRLARDYDYVGAELDPRSAAVAAERLGEIGRGRIVTGTAADVDGTFDLVCAFEVLEHIEDDTAALRLWRDRISPGGWLVISVPAWQQRWGALDDLAGHFRRYERDQLVALLSDCGFGSSDVLSYGFPLLTTVQPITDALAARRLTGDSIETRTAASGRFLQPSPWLGYVREAAALPFIYAQRPFLHSGRGIGFVAFARRE
jgi:SAM-dependent methyltransferase